jgi:ketosteroid isomerase-like protein
MTGDATRVVTKFWELMGGNDFEAVGVVLSDAFTLEWPQSGERIRGRMAFAAVNAEYPAHGRWSFTINRIVAAGDAAVSDVSVTDGVQSARAISFFTVNRDGTIDAIVEYWPEPFPAHTNRRHLVEPMAPGHGPTSDTAFAGGDRP